jgi:hypothetical protein
MKILRPSNIYDAREWTEFLELHGFDAFSVYRIDFHDDGRFTVYEVRRNSEGSPFLVDEEKRQIATMEPVTVTPLAPVPIWS